MTNHVTLDLAAPSTDEYAECASGPDFAAGRRRWRASFLFVAGSGVGLMSPQPGRLLAAAVAVAFAFSAGVAEAAPGARLKQFRVPTANSQPRDITNGSDGDRWFTEGTEFSNAPAKIARITPRGDVTEFAPDLAAACNFCILTDIAQGPGNILWIVHNDIGHSVVRSRRSEHEGARHAAMAGQAALDRQHTAESGSFFQIKSRPSARPVGACPRFAAGRAAVDRGLESAPEPPFQTGHDREITVWLRPFDAELEQARLVPGAGAGDGLGRRDQPRRNDPWREGGRLDDGPPGKRHRYLPDVVRLVLDMQVWRDGLDRCDQAILPDRRVIRRKRSKDVDQRGGGFLFGHEIRPGKALSQHRLGPGPLPARGPEGVVRPRGPAALRHGHRVGSLARVPADPAEGRPRWLLEAVPRRPT